MLGTVNSASIVQQGNFLQGGGNGRPDDLRLPPPYTSSILSQQSQSERQSQETDPTLEMELSGGAQGNDEADAESVPVMMDPPVDSNSTAVEAAPEAEAEDAGQNSVEVEIEVNANGYDYSSYADLLNKQWPMMTERCVHGVNEFNPLTQKRVYTVGVMAPAGVETAWREHNITFTKYLNAVVGPRFDPPISFEMEVTTRPINDWVRIRKLLCIFFSLLCLHVCVCVCVFIFALPVWLEPNFLHILNHPFLFFGRVLVLVLVITTPAG